MGVVGQSHTPAPYPGKETQYLLYRRLVGPQRQSGQVQKSCPHQDLIPGLSSQLWVAILTMLSQPTEDEGDEFIDGMELVQTDWICENIDTGDDVSVSYRRQFKVNLSKKTSFIFYSFFF